MKQWDDAMKRIFAVRPQDFVAWLLPVAILISKVPLELKTLTRTITADALYEVLINGQRAILHVEFQRSPDPNMAKRVWEYNVLATLEYGCPVYSFVIYLLPGGQIPESPLTWGLPEYEMIHIFRFWNIRLCNFSVRSIREKGLPGLLPLCILAEDGKHHSVAEEVFADLKQEKDLLALALTFASMVFTTNNDVPWLERETAMLEDIVRDTWFYQKILRQGLEEGREEGREEGIRLTVLDIIQERFPELAERAQQQLPFIQNADTLRQLARKVALAQSQQDIKSYLDEITENK